jgi:hypothetical protein
MQLLQQNKNGKMCEHTANNTGGHFDLVIASDVVYDVYGDGKDDLLVQTLQALLPIAHSTPNKKKKNEGCCLLALAVARSRRDVDRFLYLAEASFLVETVAFDGSCGGGDQGEHASDQGEHASEETVRNEMEDLPRVEDEAGSSWPVQCQLYRLQRPPSYTYAFDGGGLLALFLDVSPSAEVILTRARAAIGTVLGGRAAAPTFPLHLTLLYGIANETPASVETKLRDIVNGRAEAGGGGGGGGHITLNVDRTRSMNGWKFGDYDRFRMRFLQLQYDLPAALVALRDRVDGCFPGTQSTGTPGAAWEPHMSLLYLDSGDPRFELSDARTLFETTVPEVLTTPVEVTGVSIWSTEGRTDEWKRLATVSL